MLAKGALVNSHILYGYTISFNILSLFLVNTSPLEMTTDVSSDLKAV